MSARLKLVTRAKALQASAQKFLAEAHVSAKAFRLAALARASRFAIQTSDRLSRVVLIGLFAMACLLPFEIRREALVASDPAVEVLRTRPDAPPLAGGSPPPAVAPETAPPALAEAKPDAPLTDAKSAKPLPPSKQPAPPWTDSEIAAANAECDRVLDKVTYVAEELPPVREGICGAPAPRLLKSLGADKIKIDPPATLSCPMIAAMNTWTSEKLQAAAKANFDSPVVRILAGSYSCRNRYGLARAPISEHALMNAIDISGFVLANGKVVRVSKGWKAPPDPAKDSAAAAPEAEPEDNATGMRAAAAKLGAHAVPSVVVKVKITRTKHDKQQEATSAFLHQAHSDACSLFGTVLGPEANEAHRDHFHLDMKARRIRSICH